MSDAGDAAGPPSRLRDLLRFLIGDRDAIERLAADPHALWVSLLLVLSAGLAREYDAVYLPAEPHHALVPVGASLGASFVLFLVLYGVGRWPEAGRPPFLAGYRRFLTLFWLTAPLAWAYAVPWERLLAPEDAVWANLWTLAVVAVWRVVLTVRVVDVLYGAGSSATWPVLLFADTAALVAVVAAPVPLIAIMGGVRSPAERALADAAQLVFCSGALTWPAWAIGTARIRSRASEWRPAPPRPPPPAPPYTLYALAAAALLAGAGLLAVGQPERRLARRVERALAADRFGDAFGVLADHPRDAFPPHWVPPPRGVWNDVELDRLLSVLEAALAPDARAPSWVVRAYRDALLHPRLEHQLRFLGRRARADRVRAVLAGLPAAGAEGASVELGWIEETSGEHRTETVPVGAAGE